MNSALEWLLQPHDTAARRIVPDDDWRWDATDVDTAPAALWGRPAQSPVGLRHGVRHAAARERALLSLRHASRRRFGRRTLHRLPPPRHGDGVRAAVKSVLMSGAIVELSATGDERRRIDDLEAQLAEAVGSPLHRGALHVGYADDVRLDLTAADGRRFIARVAAEGPYDCLHAADGLALVARSDNARLAPALLGRGQIDAWTWSLEERLVGQRPRRLTSALLRDVSEFSAALPRSGDFASPPGREIDALLKHFPDQRAELESVSQRMNALAQRLPGVASHGDLKRGNLLAHRGRLSGVVDWDRWRDNAVPGLDLLWLIAYEEKNSRRERHLGPVVKERPWHWPSFLSTSSTYWRAVDVVPDDRTLDEIGLAWWVHHVGGQLLTHPTLAYDSDWTANSFAAALDFFVREARP